MSLQQHLYTEHTLIDVLNRYIEELLSSGGISELLHANKLISYRNTIKDKQFLRDARKLFNETYDLIDKNHPALNFSIAGRRKSLISTEKKINQYFELNKSLDLIRDFIAFRIILFGNDSLDLVKHCYMVIEDIIEHAAKRGFTPCERLPLIGVQNLEDHKNPFFSAFKYKQFVKDYICFPKENGYKSIHLVLTDTKGRYLEIQIRTFEMHCEIESGCANHGDYKQQRYPTDIPLDREKISINGYSFYNQKVFDFAGIEEPITIFQRQKTF